MKIIFKEGQQAIFSGPKNEKEREKRSKFKFYDSKRYKELEDKVVSILAMDSRYYYIKNEKDTTAIVLKSWLKPFKLKLKDFLK